LAAVTVAENVAVAGTVVANITAADEEGIASLAITSDASNYFTVNGTNVELTAAGATYTNMNGSLPYDIEVTVTDTGAQTAVSTVTANITPFDELPTITLTAVTVAENAAVAGTVVANITAADEEGIASLAITSDASNYFTVNGANVELTAVGATYVNTNGSLPYNIEVTVTDTGAQAAVTTVSADITAFDELPTLSLGTVPVTASTAVTGTVVANVAVADEEGIASMTLTSDANNYLTVNGSNVELTAAGASYVTANGALPYDIEVTVMDTGAQAAVNAVTADITSLTPLATLLTDAPDGWLQVLESQRSPDNFFPDESAETTDNLLGDLGMPSPDEGETEAPGEAESDGEETGGWTPRFSGSTRQDQLEDTVYDWDSGIYLASTADLKMVNVRLRAENLQAFSEQLEEVAVAMKAENANLNEGGSMATELLFALDDMRSQLESAAQRDFADEMVVANMLRIAGTTISAGFLIWLLRAAPLLASVLTTLPAWSRFDPLPVLLKKDEEEEEVVWVEKDEDDEDVAAERFFDNLELDGTEPKQNA
jgi:hypothetical protein